MANYVVLICEQPDCGGSLRVRRGDLPHCPMCDPHRERAPQWRVALSGEITKADRRLLKTLRIEAEDD